MSDQQFDAYISFAAEDARWAQRLHEELAHVGLRTFIFGWRPDKNWDEEQMSALRNSRGLVALWSHHAKESRWVHEELNTFSHDSRPVVAIGLGWGPEGEYHLPYPVQWVTDLDELYEGGAERIPPELWARVAERVVEAIRPDAPATKAGPQQQQAAAGPDEPDTTAAPPEEERVATQRDDPATVDELGRRPFAEVIGARMDEVWKGRRGKGDDGAFIVHVHGPWGAGKTSVLNFLRMYLQDPEHPRPEPWVVVEFNAWQNQRIRPPWWTLIREIYAQSARQVGPGRSLLLRARWLWWRVRANWLPPLVAVALLLAAVLLVTGVIDLVPDPQPAGGRGSAGAPTASTRRTEELAKAIELALKLPVALLAAGAAVVTFGRSLVFGSARAAQTYADLSSDPLRPIVGLFRRLVAAVRRPVAVLVDDLDRCESKYVIELLEGIQTLFRGAPVTYVVAGDRRWICSSFEKSYEDFGGTIGEPGRPLGYLFLDKVFQLSASVPSLTPEMRETYWKALLRTGSADPAEVEQRRREAERDAHQAVQGAHTQEELERRIGEAGGDPMRKQAMRAAAARQITTPEALRRTEHRLQRFAGLLEPNPRSMKRLVNAYGLHQATHLLEGRRVAPDALARWTIVELRWPLLADALAEHPQWVAGLAAGAPPDDPDLPADLKKLFRDTEVRAVVSGDGTGAALDEPAIREMVGLGGTAATGAAAGHATAEPAPA